MSRVPRARFDAHISKKWNGYGAAAMRTETREMRNLLNDTRRKSANADMQSQVLKEQCERLELNKNHLLNENAELKRRLNELESSATDAKHLKTTNDTLITENSVLKKRVMELEEVSARLRHAASFEHS